MQQKNIVDDFLANTRKGDHYKSVQSAISELAQKANLTVRVIKNNEIPDSGYNESRLNVQLDTANKIEDIYFG